MVAATLAGSASAATNQLTIDPTATLSPGHLHATLTGTVTCDPGTAGWLDGQIVQPNNASGYGSIQITCDGTPQPYAIDVSSGFFGSSGVFKPGKARREGVHVRSDGFTCTPMFTDAIIPPDEELTQAIRVHTGPAVLDPVVAPVESNGKRAIVGCLCCARGVAAISSLFNVRHPDRPASRRSGASRIAVG